ncbi:hypothetical protein KQH50_03145 [bacterium]|nr:hypothetical protein [bacterium]
MTETKPKPSHLQIATYLVILAGVLLRTYHLFTVGFARPWALGGLFLAFSRQIVQGGYTLPATIPYYTSGGLPFAYPPLPFYVEGFLAFTLGLPRFLVVNGLPPLVSVISLLVFNRLALETRRNRFARLVAVALFALLPICFTEQVEGGGLAESFGTLFIILTLLALWRLSKDPYDKRKLALAAAIWALSIMAAPASAYVSVLIFLVVIIRLLIRGRYKTGKLLLHLGGMALATGLLSSLYWGVVIGRHGIGIFLNSFTAQHHSLRNFFILSLYDTTTAPLVALPFLLLLLVLIAVCILIYHRRYDLVVLTVLAGLIPRETWVMGIIGVFATGAACDLLLTKLKDKGDSKATAKVLRYLIPLLFLVLVITRSVYFVSTRELLTPDTEITPDQIAFLAGFNETHPTDDGLVVIGGEAFLEWAPYLAEHTVLNVWQGTEFAVEKSSLFALDETLLTCENYTCLNRTLTAAFTEDMVVVIDLNVMDALRATGPDRPDNIQNYTNDLVYYSLSPSN